MEEWKPTKYRFTLQQACKYLGISELRLRALVKAGEIVPEGYDWQGYTVEDRAEIHKRERLYFVRNELDKYIKKKARMIDLQQEILEQIKFVYDEIVLMSKRISEIEKKIMEKELLTVQEVAKFLRRSAQTIRNNIIDVGTHRRLRLKSFGIDVPVYRVGKKNYFVKSDFFKE